jgi:hypothetical protein
LIARYALTPQNTGFIALGDEAEGSPEGDGTWDGIALALFLDREALRVQPQP